MALRRAAQGAASWLGSSRQAQLFSQKDATLLQAARAFAAEPAAAASTDVGFVSQVHHQG